MTNQLKGLSVINFKSRSYLLASQESIIAFLGAHAYSHRMTTISTRGVSAARATPWEGEKWRNLCTIVGADGVDTTTPVGGPFATASAPLAAGLGGSLEALSWSSSLNPVELRWHVHAAFELCQIELIAIVAKAMQRESN